MKILLTGAKGQLGREIARQADDWDLTLTDQDTLDITDKQSVLDCVLALKPDVVIHCAAYTAVDKAESDEAGACSINVCGTGNIAEACDRVGAGLVYLSTDYVFDGKKRTPYVETDAVNPLSVYGRTKQQGEEVVRQMLQKHYIIRTAWLYGDGNNFVRTMLQLADKQNELGIVNDQVGTPTFTVDLTLAIRAIVQSQAYGTYHATCQGACSWYDFACEIFRLAGKSVAVKPITTDEYPRPAKRPAYSVLDNRMLRPIGDPMREWQVALEDYLLSWRND